MTKVGHLQVLLQPDQLPVLLGASPHLRRHLFLDKVWTHEVILDFVGLSEQLRLLGEIALLGFGQQIAVLASDSVPSLIRLVPSLLGGKARVTPDYDFFVKPAFAGSRLIYVPTGVVEPAFLQQPFGDIGKTARRLIAENNPRGSAGDAIAQRIVFRNRGDRDAVRSGRQRFLSEDMPGPTRVITLEITSDLAMRRGNLCGRRKVVGEHRKLIAHPPLEGPLVFVDFVVAIRNLEVVVEKLDDLLRLPAAQVLAQAPA